MHKTISLNLGGTVFHAEEPAFEKLSQYLAAIRRNFKHEEGGEEIVQDIEARLAELFLERLNQSGVQAITMPMLDSVLQEMGNPEDFTEGENTANNPNGEPNGYMPPRTTRRLFRDPDDRILGGVCGGIGAYLGLDPLWIRLFFAVLFFGFGTGFFVYLLLWIIIPAAKTTADKLQMRGDPVNLDSINRFIRTEAQTIQEKTQGDAMRHSVNKGADIMLRIFQALVKGAVWGLAAASVAISLAVLIGLSIGLFSLVFTSALPSENPLYILINANQLLVSVIAIFLLFGIPFFWLLYKGISYLFKVPGPGTKAGYTLLLLWILGFVLAGYATTDIVSDYSATASFKKMETLQDTSIRHYKIEVLPVPNKRNRVSFFGADWTFHSGGVTEVNIYSDQVALTVEPSSTGQFEIWQVMSSRGRSNAEATLLAAGARLPIEQVDSIIRIPGGILVNEGKWRNQKVQVILKVPQGYQVEMMPSARKLWEAEEDNIYSWSDRRSGLVCKGENGNIACYEFMTEAGISQASGVMMAYDLQNFSAIEAEEDVKMTIRLGEGWNIQVYGEDRAEVVVEKKGDKLYLSNEDDLGDDTHVMIDMPALSHLRLSGATEAEILNFEKGDLTARLSGAAFLSFRGKADVLTSDCSGASEVVLYGNAQQLRHEGSGASHLRASGLEVKSGEIEVSGAAQAEVKVTESLNAKASGASAIEYFGNPARVKEQKSGAGRIQAR
jgi:phage shock protein C